MFTGIKGKKRNVEKEKKKKKEMCLNRERNTKSK